ncbi:flagellar biosynthetic protein FliO [Sporosarcina sp. FSL K6-1522]|uniref:flagellar biosynthetic protein FliO n=1 Tax=Sporosarcina sp. FSL K6-1522 TaxID=2921554 RepID=UPI00315A8134
MKSSIVLKGLSVLLLFLLFSSYSSQAVGYAAADENISVLDCLENEKENDKDCKKSKDTKEEVPEADDTTDKTAVSLTAWDYIKTLLALLFVVGLLVGLLKFINRKNRLYDKNRFMKNMGGISLGQQKSIQLVVIGDAYYLIGVGDEVRLLKEITDPLEIERLIEFYEDDGVQSPTGMLDSLLSTLKGKAKKEPATETDDFGNLFKSKLNEMKEEREQQISRLTEKERNRDE